MIERPELVHAAAQVPEGVVGLLYNLGTPRRSSWGVLKVDATLRLWADTQDAPGATAPTAPPLLRHAGKALPPAGPRPV